MHKRLVVALVGLLALWVWRPFRSDEQLQILNRVWISHLPGDEHDAIDVLVLYANQDAGIFQTASAYRGEFDRFAFSRQQDTLDVRLLQDGRRSRVRYRVTRECRPGFDWCLTLEGAPRGPRDYFSRHEWETEQPNESQAVVVGLFKPTR
ncbi:MAG: hypothetical protein AB2A00_30280 [Myxococcota bacterium]